MHESTESTKRQWAWVFTPILIGMAIIVGAITIDHATGYNCDAAFTDGLNHFTATHDQQALTAMFHDLKAHNC